MIGTYLRNKLDWINAGDPKRNRPLTESPPGENISSPRRDLFELNAWCVVNFF